MEDIRQICRVAKALGVRMMSFDSKPITPNNTVCAISTHIGEEIRTTGGINTAFVPKSKSNPAQPEHPSRPRLS